MNAKIVFEVKNKLLAKPKTKEEKEKEQRLKKQSKKSVISIRRLPWDFFESQLRVSKSAVEAQQTRAHSAHIEFGRDGLIFIS